MSQLTQQGGPKINAVVVCCCFAETQLIVKFIGKLNEQVLFWDYHYYNVDNYVTKLSWKGLWLSYQSDFLTWSL